MSRYISLLERAVSKLPPGRLEERQSIYGRARTAIHETFSDPENADACEEELRLLEEAITDIERRLAEGRLPPPEEINAGRIAKGAGASKDSSTRNKLAALPGGALFTQGSASPSAHYAPDAEEDEGVLPMRLRILGLLLFAGAAGVFMLMRPDFLRPPRSPALPPVSQAPPAPKPAVKLQDMQWTGSGGAKGVVSWAIETDTSSFAPRRVSRRVVVARADLRPLAPPVRIYFVPAGDDGFRATHFLEFRFENDERLAVAAVQSLKLGTGQSQAVEPEGVIIRTAGFGHAFVFSNAPKDAIVNEALLSQTEEFVFTLRLENGSTPSITMQTVKLKPEQK